ANLANAFVDNVSQYAVLRFIAGFGLAGELGAGITLVSELMSVHRRGMGTTIVTAAGVLGGICGGLVGNLFTWQTAYIIGGCAGFVLLLLRLGLVESGLFISLKTNDNVPKGSLSQFYKKPALFKKYLRCLFIGMPFWIFVGLFMTLAPELGNRLGVTSQVTTSWALLYFNVGLGLGELSSGLLSQWLGSRKKVVSLYIIFSFSVMMAFLNLQDISASYFYGFCALMGLSIGYWAVFLVMSAEQFGTNLRATVTVSLPNFVRGMAVPMTLLLTMLKLHLGIITSLGIIGTTSLFLALLCVFSLPETFARDLDFVET
ncbi:MAG: MFS transporter, partial [Candidatus Berkiella sp.]